MAWRLCAVPDIPNLLPHLAGYANKSCVYTSRYFPGDRIGGYYIPVWGAGRTAGYEDIM